MIDDISVGSLGLQLLRNPRRRMVEQICCEACGERGQKRTSKIKQRMAYWHCPDCGFRWKELREVSQP